MTKTDLEEVLSELGETPEAVADTLRRAGCKGRVGDEGDCPAARWFERRFPGHSAFVDGLFVLLVNPETEERVSAVVPDGLNVFVGEFDAGTYPDLVE